MNIKAFIAIILLIGSGAAYATEGCRGNCRQDGGENVNVQGQISVNRNSTSSRSHAQSDSDSASVSNASIGSVSTDGGRSDASSSSSSGDNNSTISVDTGQNSAAGAAAVYASYCINGASGQGVTGGASIASQDVLCEHMKVADRMLIAYQQMVEWCASGTNPACDRELEKAYYEAYTENIADVERIMAQTSVTGQISKTGGQLVIPAALLLLLFLL
jgi:hypothetical protein